MSLLEDTRTLLASQKFGRLGAALVALLDVEDSHTHVELLGILVARMTSEESSMMPGSGDPKKFSP